MHSLTSQQSISSHGSHGMSRHDRTFNRNGRITGRRDAHLVAHRVLAASLIIMAITFALPTTSTAQDESVKPGINSRFADPNVVLFKNIFEGESREIFMYREAIVAVLDLQPKMVVADVGAGTGLFTRLFGERLGAEGRVYAVEISQKFLDHVESTCREAELQNVVPILCDQQSTGLPPDSVDLVFVCDTYHHFEYPRQTLASIHRALRPGGTLVIIDFERITGVSPIWVIGHVRCGKGTVTDEVKDAGFDLATEIPLMKGQYVLKFTKRPAKENKQSDG